MGLVSRWMQRRVWQTAALRGAVLTLNSLLLVGLAYTLTLLIFALRAAPQTTLPPPPTHPQPQHPLPTTDLAKLQSWQPFGTLDTNERPPPTTRLNLRLMGVFAAPPNSPWALALLAEGEQSARSYRIGDQLPGGARLQHVAADHVLIERHGRLEKLSLQQQSDLALPTSAPRTAPLTDGSAIATRLRQEMLKRPAALQDLVSATPVVENGQFIGLRLQPGRNRQWFEQLGLQGGDVLVAINGTRLTDAAQSVATFQTLMDADTVAVRVLRNGAELELTFNFGGTPAAPEN